MVQAYHAVPVSVEYEDTDSGQPAEHEGSALLGSRASGVGVVKSEPQKEGHAMLSSSIVNLLNTIIGSGECIHHHSPLFCRYNLRLTIYGHGFKACSPSLGYVLPVCLSTSCWKSTLCVLIL